ncbi:hypothetical protein WJX79_007422 [Trebouxia sp. C0005]
MQQCLTQQGLWQRSAHRSPLQGSGVCKSFCRSRSGIRRPLQFTTPRTYNFGAYKQGGSDTSPTSYGEVETVGSTSDSQSKWGRGFRDATEDDDDRPSESLKATQGGVQQDAEEAKQDMLRSFSNMLLIQRSLERVGSLCSLDSAAAGTDILPTCFFQDFGQLSWSHIHCWGPLFLDLGSAWCATCCHGAFAGGTAGSCQHQASSIRGPKAGWGSFPAGNRVAARILFQIVNDNGHCQQGRQTVQQCSLGAAKQQGDMAAPITPQRVASARLISQDTDIRTFKKKPYMVGGNQEPNCTNCLIDDGLAGYYKRLTCPYEEQRDFLEHLITRAEMGDQAMKPC